MRFFHHIYIERLTFFCLGHRAHTRTYIRTHETQFSLRSAHIKNIGGITNKFLVCFFFFIPKKACQPFTPCKIYVLSVSKLSPSFCVSFGCFFFYLFLHCTLSKATTSTIKVRTTRVYFSQLRGKGVPRSRQLVVVHEDTQVSNGEVLLLCPANFRSRVRHTNTHI